MQYVLLASQSQFWEGFEAHFAGESEVGHWPALGFASRLPRQSAKVRVEDRLGAASLLTTNLFISRIEVQCRNGTVVEISKVIKEAQQGTFPQKPITLCIGLIRHSGSCTYHKNIMVKIEHVKITKLKITLLQYPSQNCKSF